MLMICRQAEIGRRIASPDGRSSQSALSYVPLLPQDFGILRKLRQGYRIVRDMG